MTQRNTTHLSPTQRHALIVAGALTAFVLVLVGAIANRVTQEAALDLPSPTVAVPSTAIPAAGPDPAVQAMIDQRDAAYQQAIQEANDRLAQANDRLKQALAAPPSPAQAQPPGPPQPTYLAADRAASLALVVASGASVTAAPDLVNFQGTAAYEVITDRGTVFVDATSGQILYNGAGVAAATGGGGGGGGEHEDDEHEDDEHEDEEHDEGGHDD